MPVVADRLFWSIYLYPKTRISNAGCLGLLDKNLKLKWGCWISYWLSSTYSFAIKLESGFEKSNTAILKNSYIFECASCSTQMLTFLKLYVFSKNLWFHKQRILGYNRISVVTEESVDGILSLNYSKKIKKLKNSEWIISLKIVHELMEDQPQCI